MKVHAANFCLLFVLCCYFSFSSGAQEVYPFTKGLIAVSETRYGREALYKDALAWQLYSHELNVPVEGGLFGMNAAGQPVIWKTVLVDSLNRFRTRGFGLGGSYLYLSYTSDKDRPALLHLTGDADFFFNGAPHAGDPYSLGWLYIPVRLKKGLNELYIRVYGQVTASLIFPAKEVQLNAEDATLPVVVVGAPGNESLQGAVVVINNSLKALKHYSIDAETEGKKYVTEIPVVGPMSCRKVPFVFSGAGARSKGHFDCRLALLNGDRVMDEKTLAVESVDTGESYSVTFRSGIDGSLQYYAVTPGGLPAAQGLAPAAQRPALFLSVHGAGVEAIGQARAYHSKDWGVLVAATNRRPRGFNWEDWGRLDALEVLALARQRFHPDPQRIYLTGHSMGGHGTWYLGATYPEKWAAIGACSGYPTLKDYGSHDGVVPDSGQTPVEQMLLRASNQSDVIKLATNYKPLGVYILHGDSDKVVPVRFARQMRTVLGAFHSDMSYHEVPGAEHWFGNQSVDWGPLFDFFKWHFRKPDSLVNQIDFKTASPGISDAYYWASIRQQQHPLMYSQIRLTRDKGAGTIEGHTENVRLLCFSLADFGPQVKIKIGLDGLPPVAYTTASAQDSVYLLRGEDGWTMVARPGPDQKGPQRYGTFKEPFGNDMVFVYGTTGNEAENGWSGDKARFDAETWYYRGNGAVDIVSDKEFLQNDYAGRSVILYGNASTNAAWKKLLGNCPIQVERNKITVGEKVWEGDSLGAYFVWPLESSPIASVGVISGSGLKGMEAANANQYFAGASGFPDFMIFGLDMLKAGSAGVRVAGFFDQGWKLSKTEYEENWVADGGGAAAYKDSTQPIEKRVGDLLSRMTDEEKFWQLFMIPGDIPAGEEDKYNHGLFGFQVSAAQKKGDAGAQMLDYGVSDDAAALAGKINSLQKYFVSRSRLGIPIIAFDEALHGLVRGGATVFPQSIGLAATWDTALVGKVAGAIAAEARVRGIRQILSPVINIASDPRWGRVEETYGEDPLLTSAMGVAFVGAFERRGIVTTPKHLVANVGDGGRDSYPIHYDERLLDEIYFPPFRACIEKGGSRSVMTAYNSLDGVPCDANPWLLTTKLKGDWGFKGFVISDANAVGGANVLHYTSPDNAVSAKQAVNAGLDVIFQTSYEHYKLFIPHFLDGGIDKKRIDDAVSRVLRAKFELGLFEHPYVTKADLENWGDMTAHKQLARHTALESIVLLKNDRSVLPLGGAVHSIAVVGIDATEGRLGGYSGPGNGKVSILDGIIQRAGSQVKVSYAPGCGRATREWTVIGADWLANGLKGEYFNNITLSGEPVVVRVDKSIDFQWTLGYPAHGIHHDFYSVRWTGVLHAPRTGSYRIGLDGDDGFRLYLDGRLVVDNWDKRGYSTKMTEYSFQKGRDYSIRVEFFEPVGNAHVKLIWNADVDEDGDGKIDSAVAAVGKADVAVVVAGIIEGEFQDRASLALPGRQEEMIKRIAATGKAVIVVLVGGSAVTMSSWLDRVQGVLAVWYPGEEGGHAVAHVLFGDYNPAGRLPISFPVSEAQLPWVYDHKPTGRGDDYNNLTGLSLFPFGYGLSYTNFDYSRLRMDRTEMGRGDSTIVRCAVKNTGFREGDEVVQLYFREPVSAVARPVIELKGFQRIHLGPGESQDVSFLVSPEMLQVLDKDLHWVVEPGDYQLMIGASSRDLRLKGVLKVN